MGKKRAAGFTVTPPCCDVWPQIADAFQWFVTEDKRHRLMPSILVDASFWRVNVCPSCGAPRRSVVEEVLR